VLRALYEMNSVQISRTFILATIAGFWPYIIIGETYSPGYLNQVPVTDISAFLFIFTNSIICPPFLGYILFTDNINQITQFSALNFLYALLTQLSFIYIQKLNAQRIHKILLALISFVALFVLTISIYFALSLGLI